MADWEKMGTGEKRWKQRCVLLPEVTKVAIVSDSPKPSEGSDLLLEGIGQSTVNKC